MNKLPNIAPPATRFSRNSQNHGERTSGHPGEYISGRPGSQITANTGQRRTHTALILGMGLLLVLAHACKPVREIIPTAPIMATSQAISSMHAAQPSYDFYSARFSGNAFFDGSQYPASGTIRIRKDSAIYISVSPYFGIEVVRLLVTPDTLKYLNRMESTFFEGDTRFLRNLFSADIDFYMLQALLTGSDLTHFSTDNFRVSADRDMLLLHASDRRRTGPNPGVTNLDHNLWLNSETFSIMQTTLHDRVSQHSIQARYPSHTSLGGRPFPAEVRLVFLDPNNRAELNINYSRATINQPQQMSFSVPRGYTPMNL